VSVPVSSTEVQSDQIIIAQEEICVFIARVSENARRGAHISTRLTPRAGPTFKGLNAVGKRRVRGQERVVNTSKRGTDEVLKKKRILDDVL